MVRLLAAALASTRLWEALSSSSCSSGDNAASFGAVQLQLQAAQSSRGVVAEHDKHSQDGALDFGDAVSASLATGERLHAAAAEVRRAEAQMKERYSPSVNEVEDLLSGMTGHTSTAVDKCTTQLYEFKHKITHMHEAVTSIAVEVNSTEASIYSYEEACKEKTTEISIIEKARSKRTTKCTTETKTTKTTLTSLKADMVSMKRIASAHLHVSGGGYGGDSGGYRTSLIEMEQSKPQAPPRESPEAKDPQQRLQRVQSMVQRTKDIAQQANACVAAEAKLHGQSAEQGNVSLISEDGHTAEVFLEIDHRDETEGTPRCPDNMKPTCPGVRCVHGRWRCPDDRPCSGLVPRCQPVSCIRGEWVCGRNDRCTGPVPRCHPLSCVNGEWTCRNGPGKCQAVIIELQHVFTTSYVSLTRLIEEYEVTEHSTVCEDSVEQEYSKEVGVVQHEADKVCKRVQVLIMRLEQYKLQLTQTIQTEHTMEHSVHTLKTECGGLTETSGYLTAVTGTLTALGDCPGLNDMTFQLPTWTGDWAGFKQRRGMRDAAVDAAMTAACARAFGDTYGKSVRAAETSELDEQSVQGMPRSNTASQPLMGACPMCEGKRKKRSSPARGLARICWDAGDVIGPDAKRTDCVSGARAVLCVYEPAPLRPVDPPVNPPVNQKPYPKPRPYNLK